MKSGGRIIMIGSYVGERAMTPGLVALLSHEGSRDDVHSGIVQRGREPRYHRQQRLAGPIDTDLNPAPGEWAAPQKAATALI
jgi:3-oxoacyl-[acyl-carrier protein] reductase